MVEEYWKCLYLQAPASSLSKYYADWKFLDRTGSFMISSQVKLFSYLDEFNMM